MFHTVLRLGLILLLACSLYSCAGTSGSSVSSATSAMDNVTQPDNGYIDGEQYIDLAGWQAWLVDPGEPNVDYVPDRITVSYLPGAQLPKGVSAVAPVGLTRAADCPNAILRREAGYEELTDTIAARYGLEIDSQVYWGRVLAAGFRVPTGIDADSVLTSLRTEFAGTVEFAHYAQLYHRDDYVPNDPDFVNSNSSSHTPLWGLHKINAAQAWENSRGKALERIAVVDTGVRITHEELSAQVLDPEVYFPAEILDIANNNNTMEDMDGHGTFISGEVAAEANNGRTLAGLAHLCQVIPIKITNADSATDMNIITGCALGFNLGARTISLSFGDYHTNPSMENLVNQIWDNGGIFVASAGNDGDLPIGISPHYPSDYPNSVSVGSTQVNDTRSEFSNYGQYVDIAAPGEYIKSCKNTGDSDYVDGSQGTSFASPLVAAAAALLWSYDDTLTNSEVRNLLQSTTKPTTGFTQGDVGRLDIGAAMSELAGVKVYPPKPDRLVHSGVVTLSPTVTGDADRVECFLNGQLLETRDAAPWNFSMDTQTIDYGYGHVRFIGYHEEQQSTSNTFLLIDNSVGNFPVSESFEGMTRDFQALDVKGYSMSLLESIKSYPASEWTSDEITFGGSGVWNDETGDTYDSYTSKYFGTGGDNYDSFEVDALISRRLDLVGVDNPTLVFYHHYNIEDGGSDFDRGFVYVTTDNGQTFSVATRNAGGDALYSGYLPGWTKEEIDLSSYSGQKVHIVFVMESDPVRSGENESEPSGWWIDKITVSMDYIEDMPAIGDISVTPYSLYGVVPGSLSMDVSVGTTENVAGLTFILDCLPLGVDDDPNDITVDVGGGPFNTLIDVPGGFPNQIANLLVKYHDDSSVPGPTKVIPVYIFNSVGDTNLDGLVDESDLTGFTGRLGVFQGAPGYVPFYDCNYDGVINELDAALVGYNYSPAG